MRFTGVTLRDFRNYGSLSLELDPGITVLYGANGSGKTNLLEALHLLSVGRSHRARDDAEMVALGAESASAACVTERRDGRHQVEVRLTPGEKPRKRVLLSGKTAPRIGDLMGHATAVMFSPEDLRIVRDGPAARRRFLDMQLSQIRPAYLRALKTYLSCLESRNALLREEKLTGAPDFAAQMDTWDEQLATAAVPVVNARRWFLENLNREASARYSLISENPGEAFSLAYEGPLANTNDPKKALLQALEKTRRQDVDRMFTWHGPHRDDVALTLQGEELRIIGSQGQLRSAVLSLKLGEIALIEKEMGEAPALLLDDVFSELDTRRRSALLSGTEGLQTLLTCTDRSDAAGARADRFLEVVRGENGMASVREGTI